MRKVITRTIRTRLRRAPLALPYQEPPTASPVRFDPSQETAAAAVARNRAA
jgi:hypothetical protein